MKIGFLLDDSLDKSDGVQQYVLSLGNYYRTRGHEVHYLVGETERTDIAHVHSMSKNLRTHFNHNRMSTPIFVKKNKIKTILSETQLDVLHVQMPYSPLLAGKIINMAKENTAIVGTFHIVPFSRTEYVASKILASLVSNSSKRINAIYSVSKPAQMFAKKAFNIQTKVLPNVVNVRLYENAKPFNEMDDDIVTIVFLGRLVERKGCLYLLRAIKHLHQQKSLSRVRVIICGTGPLLNSLKVFVARHNLKKLVTFVGFVDESNKARYLASADIAVFPSTGGESFGIVLIEAMAASNGAVLAGDNIGYRSVLHGHENQLFNPKELESFSDLLLHYISSKKARKEASSWQKTFVKNYDVSVVGDQLLINYENLINDISAKI